ncbi:MAG: PAS domain-containing protein [Burkholderiales bacterium]|nr:PAS domain-containing protein [Burkholderiales bacterium]
MSAPPPATAPTPAAGLCIVGLGASAGGLDPLAPFLAAVPPASGLAWVVVQHLDPTQKAMLAPLLQRATRMPVHEVTAAVPIAGDTVYVIAPNTDLTVRQGALHLSVPPQPRGQRLPVDALFVSLARELGSRAVGVVLSGMGSDGSRGVQAIRAQGGLTLAQCPGAAQFDSMPRSAIATGCVDIVAPAAEMPQRILQALAARPLPAGPAAARAAGPPDAALATILSLLRAHTRHDFAAYKSSTLLRRAERRRAVHALPDLAAYARALAGNGQELDLLFKEMLIGVTAFFRDPPVWQLLQDVVLPRLLDRRAGGDPPLRAWVAGCSTGEEAYTLAMCFAELVDARPPSAGASLQIFATDLNPDAIAVARSGRFGPALERELSPQRLARHFRPGPGGWRIEPRLRDMVLFAEHDVIRDPPFTRLDLLCCRNLMIYFDAALQARLVPLFHYSLRPGGALLLGQSETVGRAHALFEPLHPRSRLYLRSDNGAAPAGPHFPTRGRAPPRAAHQETTLPHPSPPAGALQTLADQLLLQAYAPPAVLVNAGGDIVYVSGRTGRYLEPAAGKANWNLHVMARPALRTPLALALRQALLERSTVELRGLRPEEDGRDRVDITVRALGLPVGLEGMALVVFREAPARRASAPRAATAAADAALAEELGHSREEIRALRQEMQASKEELQAANEELQSTNEELQSANEELTTSKEEAQSMNEELQTINAELQSKLDDLALAQSDMQNLLNSTDIATLFLDSELQVRRYTDKIARLVHLRESDIGRPLSELASTLVYPALHADVRETLRTLAFSEKQIATTDGLWFNVRIMPYRTQANVIQGVVVTFVDITAAKALEARLRKA